MWRRRRPASFLDSAMSLLDSLLRFTDPEYREALLYAVLVLGFAVFDFAERRGWF